MTLNRVTPCLGGHANVLPHSQTTMRPWCLEEDVDYLQKVGFPTLAQNSALVRPDWNREPLGSRPRSRPHVLYVMGPSQL